MAFDSNKANIKAAMSGIYAGESQDPQAAGQINRLVRQDWQANSAYLSYDAEISSGPKGTHVQLNVVVPWGTDEVKTGMVFHANASKQAAFGLPNKDADATAKMAYICLRGADHFDANQGALGIPVTAGVEMVTTCYDSTKTYSVDQDLFAQYTGGAFTGLITNAGADTLDNTAGTVSPNCPIIGKVSIGFYANSTVKVGDPANLSGQGFIQIPMLRLLTVYDVARGVAVS